MKWFSCYPECREVIVNTRSERAFRGVLWRKRPGYLVLRNVLLLRPNDVPAHIDGEVVIPAGNVDFIQVVQI